MSRRCSDPTCDAGAKGKPARVSRRFRMCRVCRMIAAVKKGAQRAREDGTGSDEDTSASVPTEHCAMGGS